MSSADPTPTEPEEPRESDELLGRLSALQERADQFQAELREAQEKIDEILRGGAGTGDKS